MDETKPDSTSSGWGSFADNIVKLSQGAAPIISAIKGGSNQQMRAEQIYYDRLNGSGAPDSRLFYRGTDVPPTDGQSAKDSRMPPKWLFYLLGGVVLLVVVRKFLR